MALAPCRECGKEVSSEAETCPHCGIKKPVVPPMPFRGSASGDGGEPGQAAQSGDGPDVEKPEVEKIVSNVLKVGGVVLVGWLILSGKFSDIIASFTANVVGACELQTLELKPDAFLINGEMDFGYTAIVVIKQEGRAGNATLEVTLSSPEGDFTKQRTVHLVDGQQQTISIKFPEPTINSDNATAEARCSTF